MFAGKIERMRENWDSAHNGLPSVIQDCFVRLKRLTEKEIKMYARSSGKRISDPEFITGSPKKKFKRILPTNDNSEDEEEAISLPDSGNNLHGVSKISIVKSETKDENVAETFKKSDSSNCNGGGRDAKDYSAGLKRKRVTDCSSKDAKDRVRSHPGKIYEKEPMFLGEISKSHKDDLGQDSVIPARNLEENQKEQNKLSEAEKEMPASKGQQNKAESLVPLPLSANSDKSSKNDESSARTSGDKSLPGNLIKSRVHEGINCHKDEKRPLKIKGSTNKGSDCDVERVLAQIFQSPTKTSHGERFFKSGENMHTASNAKVNITNVIKSGKTIVQPASKTSNFSKTCDRLPDVPKDVSKSNHVIQKNGEECHASLELRGENSKSSCVHQDSGDSASKTKIENSSNSIKESFPSACSKDEEPKTVCNQPLVLIDKRGEKVQRSKSMADYVADPKVQPLTSNDSKRDTNDETSPSLVKQHPHKMNHKNEKEKLYGKPITPFRHVNNSNEKVSKDVGDSGEGGNGTCYTSSKQLDRAHMKSIKRSLSSGSAPVNPGELKSIRLAQTPVKSAVSQPWPSPSPVKSKSKKVDCDQLVSTVNKNLQSSKTSNAVEIGSEFSETLHFFSKETTSVSNLSKVIEKCRQKVGASTQVKEKALPESLFADNIHKQALGSIVRTPLKTIVPSICGNSKLSKEADGVPLDPSSSEQAKAARSPSVVEEHQKVAKGVKMGSMRKPNQEDRMQGSSLEYNERCPSPLPGIVAENIDELMKEYEQLTTRATAAKASTKKKIERRPSQKKMLTMFGEEHFIEDCQSIMQIPHANKEKAFLEKQSVSSLGSIDPVSLAEKVPAIKSSESTSERDAVNVEDLGCSKVKVGKKRNLSETLQRKKKIEKVRRNSLGALQEAVKISVKEPTFTQDNPVEKSKSFAQKQCVTVSSNVVSPFSSKNIIDPGSIKEKSKKALKKPRKSTERRLSSEKHVGERKDKKIGRIHSSDNLLKIDQSKSLDDCKIGGNSLEKRADSKCLRLDNDCKTQENESISAVINEVNPKDPLLGENLDIRSKVKEDKSGNEGVGTAEENSVENIEATGDEVISQVPTVVSATGDQVISQVPTASPSCNTIGSVVVENSLNASNSSTTIECNKETPGNAAETSNLSELLTSKTVDKRNENSVDEEAKASYAKKLEDINASLSLSLGLLADIPVDSLGAEQESLENPVEAVQGKIDTSMSEYIKKLEQQHEMLEKVVGEAMAKKYMIWKQLQSYHGIKEIKKEVPDETLEDDCQVVFSTKDVSSIKDDSSSSAETEVLDWLDDSACTQTNVLDDSGRSSYETSVPEHLNPNLGTSGSKENSSGNSAAPPSEGFGTGSVKLNEKDLLNCQSTLKKETGCIEDVNEKNLDEGVSERVFAEPADVSSCGNAVTTSNSNGSNSTSSISQQSIDVEIASIPATPSESQPLTSAEELPVSQPNSVIVFNKSSEVRSLVANGSYLAQLLEKPITTSDKEVNQSKQSCDKEPTVEHNGNDLSINMVNSEGTSLLSTDSNSCRSTVNSNKDTEVLAPSVREERIRVRVIEDMLEKPATQSRVPTAESSTTNGHLRNYFISEDGVTWFRYLVVYMLKIARKVEELLQKKYFASSETLEIEETFKENCIIIYNLFRKVIVRYKDDPDYFITVLFMNMVSQWRDFKNLITLDFLKKVVKKCFAKCLELISPVKHCHFVLEANELLGKLRIFPPLVIVNQMPVTNRAVISDGAISRSLEANNAVNSGNLSTATFPNIQSGISSNGNVYKTNYSQSGYAGNNISGQIEVPSCTTQIQHVQGPPRSNQPQVNPDMVSNGGIVSQNIVQSPARHDDNTRSPMLVNMRNNQPPSESNTQRNLSLNNINVPAAENVSHLQHLIMVDRNIQIRGMANPGSCSVMNGQTSLIENSSVAANISLPNIPQVPGRNFRPLLSSSSQSQQNNLPSYTQSSSNVSSRVFQPIMDRSHYHATSDSLKGPATHVNVRPRLYPKTAVQLNQQLPLQGTSGISGSTLPVHSSSINQKEINNTHSLTGQTETQPQKLSALRSNMLGSYYGANASSSSNGAIRSSLPSMTASVSGSHSLAQHFSSNHPNSAQLLHAQGNSILPGPIVLPGRHPNPTVLGQPASFLPDINPITRQPIQAQHQPKVQVSENNNFTHMNGYQISCQVTVNPHIPYNSVNSSASFSSGGPSEFVRTAGQNSANFSGVLTSQHLNHGIFQRNEQNQQIPHRHSLSKTTGTAQGYPLHQILNSHAQIVSHQNYPNDSNSGSISNSTVSGNRRYSQENLSFQQSRTDLAVAGNPFGQSEIAAKNFSTAHTYQQYNMQTASPDNVLSSQSHPNLQPNIGRNPQAYPYSVSLMKQAEARSSLQQPLPGPAHSTSPGTFPEDCDQALVQGTNRSVSRDSGYRSPSQVNEVDPCYVCGKEARNTCSACKSVFYCHFDCQMGDWERHKWECRSTN